MGTAEDAQDVELRFRNDAIAAALPPAPVRESAEHCAWCGEDIPEGRRLAVPGCDLCAGCQEQKEHLKERR